MLKYHIGIYFINYECLNGWQIKTSVFIMLHFITLAINTSEGSLNIIFLSGFGETNLFECTYIFKYVHIFQLKYTIPM